MALYQTNAGDRILAADINQYFNLLKGVAGSGEGVTLIYNAAGVLVLQPSTNPAAGTELVQIKNAAGTVQGALSSDGMIYAADGVVGGPGHTFENDKDTGLYRSGANALDVAAGGTRIATFDAAGLTMQSKRMALAKGADIASAATITPGTDGNYFHITGATTITAIASLQAGTVIFLHFTGALTLTHNSVSLILQGGTNLATAAGDVVALISEGGGNWRELFRRLASAASSGVSVKERLSHEVDATETTTSTTLTDLTTVGPTVTTAVATLNDKLLIQFVSGMYASTTGNGPCIGLDLDGVDTDNIVYNDGWVGVNVSQTQGGIKTYTGLSAATHTVKMQYRTQGAGTAGFARRKMSVDRYA